MRVHLRFHNRPESLIKYLPRPGAEIIGGTLPFAGNDRTTWALRRLSAEAPGKRLAHITLSLPEGYRADKDEWLAIIKFVMAEKGLPPDQTPWFAVRHLDANTDHVHVAIALATFCERPLEPVTSKEQTDRLHEDLAARLCLPVPAYFRSSLGPRLDPPTPVRRVNQSPFHRALYEDLRHVFRRASAEGPRRAAGPDARAARAVHPQAGTQPGGPRHLSVAERQVWRAPRRQPRRSLGAAAPRPTTGALKGAPHPSGPAAVAPTPSLYPRISAKKDHPR